MNPQKINTSNPEGADLQQLKENMLVKVLTLSGIGISSNEWRAWRPTRVVRGVIAGIDQSVKAFATDGNLAIFQTTVPTENLGTWFVGHVRDFQWDDGNGNTKQGCPPSLFAKDSTAQPRKAGQKKAVKTEKEKLRDRVAKLENLLGL